MSRSRWQPDSQKFRRAWKATRLRTDAWRCARLRGDRDEIIRGVDEAAQVSDGDYAHHRAWAWARIEASQDRRGRKRSWRWRSDNRIRRKLRRAFARLVPWCGAELRAALESEIAKLRGYLRLTADIYGFKPDIVDEDRPGYVLDRSKR